MSLGTLFGKICSMLVVGKSLVDLLPDLFWNEPDPLTPEPDDDVLDEDRIPKYDIVSEVSFMTGDVSGRRAGTLPIIMAMLRSMPAHMRPITVV